MVDPVDYELVLRYPDRGEPDHSDFTSFEGEVEVGQVLILPEKGERYAAEDRGGRSGRARSSARA